MVTDYESVAQVARDNETFAHKYEPDAPDGISYMGICGVPRPGYIPRQGVSEIDGPEHADLRRVLNPLMTINAVESNRPRMEAVSAWFLDEIVESGEADLVLDYTTPVPAVLTLEMMGMVSSNWQHYADFFHATSSYEPTDERYLSAIAHQPDMWGELRDFAAFRRDNPANDVTTALVSSPLDGPDAGRRRDHRHYVEPCGGRSRHHHLAGVVGPAPPGHPPRGPHPAHRESEPDPSCGGGVLAPLQPQRDPHPHRHP